jgi:hypothetical protein
MDARALAAEIARVVDGAHTGWIVAGWLAGFFYYRICVNSSPGTQALPPCLVHQLLTVAWHVYWSSMVYSCPLNDTRVHAGVRA